MSKIFIDTNILVYSMDQSDLKMKKRCQAALKTIDDTLTGVISTQVMQEFYVVATRKLGVEPLLAKSILHAFENFEVVVVDSMLIKEAIDTSIVNQISFWDALIVVSAESAKCEKIWTEDLQHDRVIRGVQIDHILTSHR